MAKISTYPIISTPTLNDLLIGTDVEDLNITKNFTIGDIASLIIGGSYVPYIGATENVDLGAFDITSSAFIVGGGLATQFLKADGSLDATVYQPAGNYITQLSGEATASGPGNATITLSNSAVINKVLTGLTIAGDAIVATDSILTAFGKVQNQINTLVGGVQYKGTWNAATNTPTLVSSVGVQGNYYVVSVAGNTNLNGITDWKLGDWAIFNGSAWEKVDNTDAVISVNGKIGEVVLTTTDIAEGTNLYYTDLRARSAISLTTTGNNGASTYSNLTGILNVPNYTLAGLGGVPLTRELTINGTTFDLSANRSWSVGTVTSVGTSGPITGGTITGTGTIGITQSGASSDGYLSSTDWNTFNNKQNALTNPVTGTGTIFTLPMWSGATSLADSPLSYGPDAFNFQYNSATGGTVNFTNIGLTPYTYAIQMNNFGSPRSTVHSYTDGIVVNSIGGTQVSRMFANGNFVLGTGFVDNGRKLEVNGTISLLSSPTASAATQIPVFTSSPGGTTPRQLVTRTPAQLLSDIGAQGALTLTTVGTSGPATLISNTLNIPDYGSVLPGYVPYIGATQSVNLGEWGLTAGFVGFDLTPTGTPSVPGTMFWSADDETVDLVMDAAVTQKIGQETFYLVKNQTGAPIPKGTVVRANGTVGSSGRILIAPFLANGTFPSKFCIGVTAETIANGADGFVTAFGKIRKINTASYTEGTILYASSTSAGGFSTTAPQAPNNIVTVAIVITSSTNNGEIFVSPILGSNINDDEGVRITSPVNNQGLFYDSTSTLWVNKTIAAALGYTPANAATTLTINGQTFDLSANRTWSVGTVTSVGLSVPTGFSIGSSPVTGAGTLALTFASGYSLPTNASQANWDTAYSNRITSLTTTGTSGAASLISNVLNIPQYQAQGNYITSLTGEATASGPGAASVTLTNSAVTGKVLTGLTVAGSSIASTDSILTAFGKLQGQVNDLIGGLQYQGTWNASTNTPTITSGVGTDGHFYIVSVAGNTIIDGVGGWQVGDWIVFHSPAWQKVDNTESVVSVNGFTGAVTLTTSNISEGTNLYFTNARARTAISLTTTGNSGASTYNNGTGVLNVPQYSLAGLGGVPTTRSLTINGTAFDLSADRTWNVGTVTSIATTGPIQGGTIVGTGTISITQSGSASDGFLSSTDWNTFNNKQGTISLTTNNNSGLATLISNVLNVPNYTLAGLGGVPTTRTLSINGVSFDLSANRSWSVGTLTGSGNVNYVPKWNGSTSLTDSLLFDNGSGVGLGTASINASALFQMDSTTRGFLPPRMTAAQRLAISSPSQGLIIYQVDGVIGLYIYSNSVWRSLTMV
jgi:predicted heme/steroid binding protein